MSPPIIRSIVLPLNLLGIRGQIRRVCVRTNSGSVVTGTFDVWIFDRDNATGTPPLGFTPADELIFYRREGVTVVGSSTVAVINDGGPIEGNANSYRANTGDYEVDPVQAPTLANLSLMVELRASGGSPADSDITFFVTVWSEVQL